MKIQLQQQSVRLRLDERELAQLLSGETLHTTTQFGGIGHWSMALHLHEEVHAGIAAEGEAVSIGLPRIPVLALAERLPCRDGLAWDVVSQGVAMQLKFDVDVRDSVRERYPKRRDDTSVTSSV